MNKNLRFKVSFFIFPLLIIGSCSFTYAQTPTGKIPVKAISGGLPKAPDMAAFPNSSKELEQFKSYLKEIKTIKEQYAELGKDLDSLKGLDVQPEIKDSLWTGFKEKATEHAEMQINLMDDMQGKIPADYEHIRKSANNFKSFLENNKEEISSYRSFEEMGFYLDNAEENLKAFTNEHLLKLGKDPLEEYLVKQAGETLPLDQDLYGKGLDQLDISKEEIGETAREEALKRGKSMIADQTGQVGEIQNKIPSGLPGYREAGDKKEEVKNKIRKFRVFEKNELKGKPLRERWMLGGTVNSLDAFGEGVNAGLYFGYRFSQQLAVLIGPNWKKEWKSDRKLSKEGHGGHLSLRYMTKGKWLGQLGVEHNYVHSTFPDIQAQMSYKGYKTYPLLGTGKEVALTKKLRSTFMGLWDPLFNTASRLHSSPFLLRVGLSYY